MEELVAAVPELEAFSCWGRVVAPVKKKTTRNQITQRKRGKVQKSRVTEG
jgi:hypothetical protein